MKCCICENEIDPIMVDGKVAWDQGNNAEPVVKEGRCCDACNWSVVIPARLGRVRNMLDGAPIPDKVIEATANRLKKEQK